MTETNNAESVLERMLREAPGPGEVDHVASICVRDALAAGPEARYGTRPFETNSRYSVSATISWATSLGC